MKNMIDSELTLRKLEIFLAFMEKLNIAKTAEELNISGVSVHRALHSLEDVLRCPLFVQNGRNLQPLPAANTLARYAEEIVSLTQKAVKTTREAAGFGNDRMKLGSLYSLTADFIPKLVLGLKRRCPEMEIDLTMNSNENLIKQLNDEQIDAALISLAPNKKLEDKFEVLSLFDDSLYLATPSSSPHKNLKKIDLAKLKNEKFVALKSGFATSQAFQDAFKTAGFEPTVVTRLNDIFSLMNLVQAGVGYSLVPKRIKKVYGNTVKLIELENKYQSNQTIALIFPKKNERDPDNLALVAEARMVASHYSV